LTTRTPTTVSSTTDARSPRRCCNRHTTGSNRSANRYVDQPRMGSVTARIPARIGLRTTMMMNTTVSWTTSVSDHATLIRYCRIAWMSLVARDMIWPVEIRSW
jgi:hypothetical protein